MALYDLIMDMTHSEARYDTLINDRHADIMDQAVAQLTYHKIMDDARQFIIAKCVGE